MKRLLSPSSKLVILEISLPRERDDISSCGLRAFSLAGVSFLALSRQPRTCSLAPSAHHCLTGPWQSAQSWWVCAEESPRHPFLGGGQVLRTGSLFLKRGRSGGN